MTTPHLSQVGGHVLFTTVMQAPCGTPGCPAFVDIATVRRKATALRRKHNLTDDGYRIERARILDEMTEPIRGTSCNTGRLNRVHISRLLFAIRGLGRDDE